MKLIDGIKVQTNASWFFFFLEPFVTILFQISKLVILVLAICFKFMTKVITSLQDI